MTNKPLLQQALELLEISVPRDAISAPTKDADEAWAEQNAVITALRHALSTVPSQPAALPENLFPFEVDAAMKRIIYETEGTTLDDLKVIRRELELAAGEDIIKVVSRQLGDW
jgi:hypothetical protein